MKMIKLMDFNKFMTLKCIFFWSKADDPPNKPTPKSQVQKLGPEIQLIRQKIRYSFSLMLLYDSDQLK